ncbi:MAG: hypothetical protein KBG15_08235 [Kofleriaceae bacterium]|nr:hypothetical protein [Kofleriaceae bacterium]
MLGPCALCRLRSLAATCHRCSRRRFFDIAHAAAFEVEAVLDSARCSGFDGVNDRAASALAGRVAAMTTALVRGR